MSSEPPQWEVSPQAASLSTASGCGRKGHGAVGKLGSVGDGDGGRGHLRLLLGTVLIPEHLPRHG